MALSIKFCRGPMPSTLGPINWKGCKFHAMQVLLFGTVLAIICIILVALFGTGTFLAYDNSEQRCTSFLHKGRWSLAYEPSNNIQWQPYGSMLQPYDQSLTHVCLGNRSVYFIGDSTVRQIFWATAAKLDGDNAYRTSTEAGKHEDLAYSSEGSSLEFIWDPYLNSSRATSVLNISRIDSRRAAVFISTGLWHARHGGETFMGEYKNTLGRAVRNIPPKSTVSADRSTEWVAPDEIPVIAVPPPFLAHDLLNSGRASTLTRPRLSHIASHLAIVELHSGLEVAWAAREMTRGNPAAMLEGGLHVTQNIAAHQAELLLNRLCNQRFIGSNTAYSRPCVPKGRARWSWPKLVGSCLLVSESYRQVKLNRSWHEAQAITSILIIVLFCWLADRTFIFEKSNKLLSEQLFVLASFVSVLVGLICVKRILVQTTLPHTKDHHVEKSLEVLSRPQTEEWKGWMQIIILLYHYFGMSKVLWVYQIVRILVASYLFLTGYGHATYFQMKRDFSLKRVVTVLLRMNLLPCMLAVVMNNNYDFYYFPGLASLWFLITYVTLWGPKCRRLTLHETLIRIGMSMLVVSIVLRLDHPLSMIFRGLQSVFGPNVDPKEFIFRVKLDLFAPFFGMVFSIVQHHEICSQIGWCPPPALQKVLSAITVLTAYVLTIGYILVARQFHNKFTYNEYHSLLSPIPISAYIMVRNAHCAVRGVYAPLFASIGTFSLELFILQYHIWLAADTKGLLRLGWIDTPRFAPTEKSVAGSWTFWVESAITTIIFFWVSRQCAHATNTLVKWFVDANGRVLLARIAIILGILWMFNMLARINGR